MHVAIELLIQMLVWHVTDMVILESKKMPIEYKVGDLFESVDWTTDTLKFIPHCCNNEGGFGSGFVAAINKHCPEVRKRYRDWFHRGVDIASGKPFKLGQFQTVSTDIKGHPVHFLNILGQNGTINPADNPKPVKYTALAKCISDIGEMLDPLAYNEPVEIITVKFGSDLAGGDWNIISQLIEEKWNPINALPITVWSLE